ncbi:hypothetical protein [Spirillospora sp. CA-294931]|uniref:hypothetical protein n=1 Tax=Spirillospora sp. CA-294931 TaxID=3240042 RepID=UPI003D8AAB1C
MFIRFPGIAPSRALTWRFSEKVAPDHGSPTQEWRPDITALVEAAFMGAGGDPIADNRIRSELVVLVSVDIAVDLVQPRPHLLSCPRDYLSRTARDGARGRPPAGRKQGSRSIHAQVASIIRLLALPIACLS